MQISTFAFDICTYHFKDAYVIEVIYIYIIHTKLYLYNDYTTTDKKNYNNYTKCNGKRK